MTNLQSSQHHLQQIQEPEPVAPPPSYETSTEQNATGERNTKQDPNSCLTDWKTKSAITMQLFSTLRADFYYDELDWEARLEIRAKSVPNLMRQGFFWGLDNVKMEEGYFVIGKKQIPAMAKADTTGWNCARMYALTDLADDPQWIAEIWVFARKLQTLSTFRLSMLSPSQISGVTAGDGMGGQVYNYLAFHPELTFNAIYDDMPLEGWWPWPKANAKSSTC